MGSIQGAREFVPAPETLAEPDLAYGYPRFGNEVALDAATLARADITSLSGRDPRTREIDVLRTHVLGLIDANDEGTLAVVAPRAGCGASFVALNLAISMARLDERPVVLVDADLREPELTDRLGLSGMTGLAGALSGRAGLGEALVPLRAGPHHLFFVPGRAVENPAELLASRRTCAFLAETKRRLPGCLVVFDTHPMLAFDDTLALLSKVGHALLVVGAGQTHARDLETAQRLLPPDRLAAAVLNRHA